MWYSDIHVYILNIEGLINDKIYFHFIKFQYNPKFCITRHIFRVHVSYEMHKFFVPFSNSIKYYTYNCLSLTRDWETKILFNNSYKLKVFFDDVALDEFYFVHKNGKYLYICTIFVYSIFIFNTIPSILYLLNCISGRQI